VSIAGEYDPPVRSSAPVDDTTPARATPVPATARWVAPVTLAGSRVRLEPLERSHLAGLVAAGADPATWKWMHAPLTDEASMRTWMEEAIRNREAGGEVPFATVDATTGRVLGSTRFMSIAPAHRRLEIGWTWLVPAAHGTGANTEAKYLMLGHAFEQLGAMRVEFKTDARNDRSRAALAGIGATFEGVFRRHQLMGSGRVRDSAWFAVVDEDWPLVREDLRARLAAQAGVAARAASR
jgi:RimJ/RimL family protein N-acetyltransferase